MPYTPYVIELGREVLAEPKFAARNPEHRDDKPCVYVGQTACSPEERFAQHKAGHKANRYAHRYGVRLRPRLAARHGPFETREEAEKAETALAERLRTRGYAVWWG